MNIQQLTTRLEITFWQLLIQIMSAPGLRQLFAQIRSLVKDKKKTSYIRIAAAWSIGGWLLGIFFGLLTIIIQSIR